MRQSDVTAVILCWNDADRVLAMLARLETVSPRPGAVVVVDNGSRGDDADRIAAAFPSAVLVRLPANLGFAGGVNRGIREALERESRWVWLLNTDIVVPDDVLGALRDVADSRERCGVAGVVFVEADGRIQAFGGGRVDLRSGVSRHVCSPSEQPDYLAAACVLVRTSMLREIGLFDERYFFYWEDVDLGFRAREAGWELLVADRCRVIHHEGSTLGRWTSARWYRLFEGLPRFLRGRAPAPGTAVFVRLLHHSAAMAKHRRWGALVGAWRGALDGWRG